MSWTAADIPDLTGRVAVVTGGNGGLGFETASALAGAGASVLLAVRDLAKAGVARERIVARHPTAVPPEVVPLDLADLVSVTAAARRILATVDAVDILVNNAGLMAMPERRTADGFELQFGVNHLGHFALTAQLLPALLHARSARVVTVTSVARLGGRAVDPADPHLSGPRYSPWRAYGQAKLANYHFGLGLDRHFAAAGVAARSLIAHPGLSDTGLSARTVREGGGGAHGRFFAAVWPLVAMTAAAGALPQLRAATDPAAAGGALFAPWFGASGAPVRRPVLRRWDLTERIDELWAVSERETGLVLDVPAALRAGGSAAPVG